MPVEFLTDEQAEAYGKFAEEPMAAQLEIEDVSCVKEYTERLKTAYEHAWEIRDAYGYNPFEDHAQGRRFRAFLHGRAWTAHAEGPKALFDHSVGWLRRHRVLLSGVSVLARQVSEVRSPRRGCTPRSRRPPGGRTRRCLVTWSPR